MPNTLSLLISESRFSIVNSATGHPTRGLFMFGPRLDLPSTNERIAQSEMHQNSVQRPRSGNKDLCSMVCFIPGPFTVLGL
jgi:hypothetical protein